jgi:hypothetical protein
VASISPTVFGTRERYELRIFSLYMSSFSPMLGLNLFSSRAVSHHDRVYVVEAFCLLLRRLSYPNRWFDLSRQFCRHESSLCRIFYFMMHIVLSKI